MRDAEQTTAQPELRIATPAPKRAVRASLTCAPNRRSVGPPAAAFSRRGDEIPDGHRDHQRQSRIEQPFRPDPVDRHQQGSGQHEQGAGDPEKQAGPMPVPETADEVGD